LQVEILKAGGNNRTRRNFFDLFTGNKLTHSGGSLVEYTLYDIGGVAKSFGVHKKYLDYTSARQIVEDFSAGDQKRLSKAVNGQTNLANKQAGK
jgi:hypothetical protein